MKPQKILVPLDGSALAEAALSTAMELAGEAGSTLVLLRAAEAYTLLGADAIDAQIAVVREAEEYLAAVKSRLLEAGARDVKTSVWYGSSAYAIVEAARLQKADLIVMSTHGRSGFGRLMLGSVAESVLRGTSVPILLLRAPGAPVAAPGGAATSAPSREAARV